MTAQSNKDKSIQEAIRAIHKQFGSGSIMRLVSSGVPPATPSARPWRRSSPSAHQRRREALQRPSSSPPSQHIRGQFPKLLKSLIQNATGFSAHRLRPLHSHRSDLLPVQPIDQRKQLCMVQPHRGRPNPSQQNCASSSVLANRHTPVPSNQTALIRSALFERNT